MILKIRIGRGRRIRRGRKRIGILGGTILGPLPLLRSISIVYKKNFNIKIKKKICNRRHRDAPSNDRKKENSKDKSKSV